MSPRKPLKREEITELLSKLKDETPEYPSEMMAARKAAFLDKAVNILDGKGQGGEGGQQGGSGGSGGSGGTLGGAVAPGSMLQVLIGVGLAAAIFLAAYAIRDQVPEDVQGNESAVQIESSLPQPAITFTPSAPATITAVPSSSATAFAAISGLDTSVVNVDDMIINGASIVEGTPEPASDEIKTNSGLHLGQTPGTPAAPGQGNPGNPNKPEKDKPEKPDKPDKPGKPDNPGKPE